MAIRNSITEIKVFMATQIRSFSINDLSSPTGGDLRHCQEVYMGESRKARRHFKRTIVRTPKSPHAELIFAEHEANVRKLDSALPSPTSTTSGSSGRERTCNNTCSSGGAAESTQRVEIERDKWILLSSLNSARKLEGALPVILDQALSNELQAYADISEDSDLLQPVYSLGEVVSMPPTTITPATSSRGQQTVLLTSPPGLGGLACGELWYGGKYKRHAYSAPPRDRVHPENCPCHGRKVFDTVVDGVWKSVSIARYLESGRWLVELVSDEAAAREDVGCDEDGDGAWEEVPVLKVLPALPSGGRSAAVSGIK
ncbi:hypothetical protein LTR36_010923 [Oleoguttula mirabilis]|uniref:Uncharacterized protein n=1 Tax=Oleoguttula mirabilis TaxID=1507867 RepID=A0AAV9J475_9PEZI|nr:hypothetical protein LTR36_010923 [Oleoguttula mirabilis]